MYAFITFLSEESFCEILFTTHYLFYQKSLNLINVQRAKNNKKVVHPKIPSEPFNKLFIGGIPLTLTRKHLVDHFSQFGELKSVILPKKKAENQKSFNGAQFEPKKSTRGFAYITFANSEDAKQTLVSIHYLFGRQVGLSAGG